MAAAPVTGNVLVRLVNAGSCMHVPSIVGSTTGTTAKNGFALVAEDGNPVSFVPHVQSEIFMAAGKTFDALINVPAAGGTALPVFDRELSLSANKINRDAGMLAYIGVNGAGLPAASGLGAALANLDTYNAVIPGQTLTISNPGKGVIANDVNVYGVKVVTAPTKGTLTLNSDGTFTYAANSTWATSDSFVYCGNGATSGQACATVTLGAETVESASGITCGSSAFSSNVATLIKIPNPGILTNCKDAAGYPLTVVTSSIAPSSGLTVVPDVAGGFTASIASTGTTFPGGTSSFTFKAQNAQGTVTATTATATITFPAGAGGGALPLLGTNFHTSNMPFVAQGCTGPLSCETGQTMVDTGTPCTSTSPNVPAGCSPTAGQHIPAICDVGNGVCRPEPNKVPTGKAAALPGAVALDPTKLARGENWLQTDTLDGQKAHDSFLRIGEPAYFQEFGPASYHVSIGFANPKIINSRLASVCSGNDAFLPGAGNCTNTVTGKVTTERMSRTPDERLYSSGSRDSFFFTQCYVSVGDPDGEDFAFTSCNADGTFTLSGLPAGNWRVTTFDEWNDQLVDGLSFPVGLGSSQTPQICPGLGSKTGTCDMGDLAANQWQANVYTRTFIDENKDGISQPKEGGIPFINTTVRYRDGSLSNNLVTDLNGTADFNEEFPLFNWYVVEADTIRYKTTGIYTVYDSGGPADGSASCGQAGYPACGNSTIGKYLANTNETVPLPSNLQVPGAVYCDSADCTGLSIATGPIAGGSSGPGGSTGRIDPPWVPAEGWQGYSGQNNFIEFGKTPYVPGENGGIHGHVVYASTRPFDDPQMLVQTQWEPLVPNVTINLYQEGTAADGITPTLTLVDTTQSTSWDAFAQGFRSDGIPNMNCPGQTTTDLFYFSLYNQENYLNLYAAQHGGPAAPSLPNNSQFKCYDGMHNWNQLQPAPYDGMYSFPSVTGLNPSNGKPSGTNCTICTTDPDATDPYRFGAPMLPVGKYVVEVVPPAGYEIVKEEDKNILIGDDFIAPVTQEFGGLGNIFIIPDQASVAASQQYPGPGYNPNNAQNPTQSLGANPNNGIVPGFTPEPTWPCVGDLRVVPDYISLFPQSQQVAPFAGASRRLCDRKEVTLSDQAGAIAKFYIYTSTHKAAKFTGVITDDFTSEFDPFSPQFGEKFAPPNMPIAIKDWTGTEIGRVYSDWWGDYDGLTYSTWEVNPPNPTGYSPTMMIFCMNDKGTGTTPDPLFNPAYSQFCYELPYMPGQTQYLDTPVVPTSAFSAGYNHPDCNYPAATPAIKEVDGDQAKGGPHVSAFGKTLTITGLGDQVVPNYGYSGPSATTPPFNNKTATRHYGFGGAKGTVSIGGVTVPAADVNGRSDESITLTIPNTTAFTSLPVCGSSSLQCLSCIHDPGCRQSGLWAMRATRNHGSQWTNIGRCRDCHDWRKGTDVRQWQHAAFTHRDWFDSTGDRRSQSG